MKAQYDVIVVGAGPGGAVCARQLAARGASVLLVDKKRPGWHKPCGGGVPEGVFGRYDVPASLGFANPRVQIVDRHRRTRVTPVRYRDVYRNAFDEHLAEQARRAGADVEFDAGVRDLWRAGDAFVVRTAKGVCCGDYLVGADGCNSIVRRRLFGEHLRDDMCAVAVEYWYRVRHRRASLDFFVEPEVLDTGYAYAFPKDDGVLAVGVAGVDLDRPRLVLDRLVALPRFRALLGGAPVEAVHGGRIPYRHLSRLREGRLLLVGDAAGLNTPIVFAGIPVALQSGRLAGELIARALAARSDAPLDRYTVETLRAASPGFAVCHAYYDLLLAGRRPPAFTALARRFLGRPHLLPRVFMMWRALGQLVDGLDLDRLCAAGPRRGAARGLDADPRGGA
jgi:geranylgeranyl reductase family protein